MPRFTIIFSCVSNISSFPQKPITITIDNCIPSINFHLGFTLEAMDCMRMLVDTGAAINTVNKNYNLWIMSQCPAMVVEYMQYGPNTEYDVVQLLATLDLNIAQQPNTHGK